MKLPVAILLLGCFAAAPAASAYSDLTTASYLSQMILGIIFGGIVSIKMIPGLVKDLFKSTRPGKRAEEPTTPPAE